VRGDKEIGYRRTGLAIRAALLSGVSFASANYRYATQAILPEIMRDGARLIQYIRRHAAELNIDAERIAVFGGSAGSGIALFLAFHHDLADPHNPDPVLRESSRVTCAGSFAGQAMYDPRYMVDLIGSPPPASPTAAGTHAAGRPERPDLGRLFWGQAWDATDMPSELEEAIRDVGPLSLVRSGASPVFLFNPYSPEPPRDWTSWVHHPSYQRAIGDRCNELGVACRIRLASHYTARGIAFQDAARLEWLDFCLEHFRMPRTDWVHIARRIGEFDPDAPTPELADDAVYRDVQGARLWATIYRPSLAEGDPRAPRPAVIFFAGGGFRAQNRRQFLRYCLALAERGYVAVTADYRTHDDNGATVADAVDDARAAVAWLREHANEYNVDPDRIVAAGGSAGGHLAASTALSAQAASLSHTNDPCRPDALALFNPVLDLRTLSRSSRLRSGRSALSLGRPAEELSPLRYVDSEVPPALVLHGRSDRVIPFRQARRFAADVERVGGTCELHGFARKGHGFFNYQRSQLSDDGRLFEQCIAILLQFLAETGTPSPRGAQ
jgi:acetyl esterase/lipase